MDKVALCVCESSCVKTWVSDSYELKCSRTVYINSKGGKKTTSVIRAATK